VEAGSKAIPELSLRIKAWNRKRLNQHLSTFSDICEIRRRGEMQRGEPASKEIEMDIPISQHDFG